MEKLPLSMPELGMIQLALDSYIYMLEKRGISTDKWEELESKLKDFTDATEADEFLLTPKPELR